MNQLATGTGTALRRQQRQIAEIGQEFTFVDIYELCSFVQGEIVRSKLKYSAIAAKAGCCAATVSNLASGTTHQPRASTVLNILAVLGFELVVRR